MIRSVDTKAFLVGKSLIKSVRVLSAQAAVIKPADVKFKEEWNNAKDFASIPGMSKLTMMRAFMPGGEKNLENLLSRKLYLCFL